MSTVISFEFGDASPRIVRIKTTATLSEVTAAGWLKDGTKGPNAILPSDKVLVYYDLDGTPGNAFFDVAIASGVITLSVAESNIVLPVVSGDFASFSGTSGAIADLGFLPSDATKTRVVMASAAVIANHIAVYGDTTGTVNDDAATAINGGNIQAGLSGTAGFVASFPSAASKGSLRVTAVANTGDTLVTISNALHGQASVYSIPDVGAATGQFLVKTAALVSGNLVKSSGTAGVVVDAGFAVKANTTAAYAGGGTSNAFVATGLLGTSIVTAVILASTNAVSIVKAVPTADTLTVDFSADPGAATTVSWIAITPAA